MAHRTAQRGFTLFEICIVLVIIGLIAGAIVVGQDLIRAARIRSTLSQLDRYNAAVNSFREKYSALPGDFPATSATIFGFAARTGALGHGDGNRLLNGGSINGYLGPNDYSCGEISLFWNDLSTAHMIEGTYQGTDGQGGSNTCGSTNPHTVMPVSPIGNGVTVTVYADTDGLNYYYLACDASVISPGGGWTCAFPTITPSEAYALDGKADDGLPLSGSVRATTPVILWSAVPAAATPASPAPGVCVSNATGNPYNISGSANASTPACFIKFRFQ